VRRVGLELLAGSVFGSLVLLGAFAAIHFGNLIDVRITPAEPILINAAVYGAVAGAIVVLAARLEPREVMAPSPVRRVALEGALLAVAFVSLRVWTFIYQVGISKTVGATVLTEALEGVVAGAWLAPVALAERRRLLGVVAAVPCAIASATNAYYLHVVLAERSPELAFRRVAKDLRAGPLLVVACTTAVPFLVSAATRRAGRSPVARSAGATLASIALVLGASRVLRAHGGLSLWERRDLMEYASFALLLAPLVSAAASLATRLETLAGGRAPPAP
jgi:hypothetical protein